MPKPVLCEAGRVSKGLSSLYEQLKLELGNLTFFDEAGRVVETLSQDELAEELAVRLFKAGFRKVL